MSRRDPSWAVALQQLTVNGTHISAEEVVDTMLPVTARAARAAAAILVLIDM